MKLTRRIKQRMAACRKPCRLRTVHRPGVITRLREILPPGTKKYTIEQPVEVTFGK